MIKLAFHKKLEDETMRARKLLHNFFMKSCPFMHKKRALALLDTVGSLFNDAKLSLTSLGRHMPGQTKVKNKIKRVDRLCGNGNLYAERQLLYKVMAEYSIGPRPAIDVAIDWSPCPDNDKQILRACMLLRDKAVELYSEVYDIKCLGKYHAHKRFLSNLKKIIPSECKVTIITDAGFRTKWFELVVNNNWDYVGRILIDMVYSTDGGSSFEHCNTLYPAANTKAKAILGVILTKARRLHCALYIYKGRHKKIKTNPRRANGSMVEEHRKAAKTPWVLASSIQTKKANSIIKKYSLRMKIEHDFRDTKDAQWGIGLHHTRCHNIKRLEILFLIGAMARFLLWLIGLVGESKKLHFDFQANTVRKHRVLSLVYLGLQIIKHCIAKISEQDLWDILEENYAGGT